jgi:hypothetical protein
MSESRGTGFFATICMLNAQTPVTADPQRVRHVLKLPADGSRLGEGGLCTRVLHMLSSYLRDRSLGQTASEALACGTPVVAFNTGGLSDIVVHKETGYSANGSDINDLENGIR